MNLLALDTSMGACGAAVLRAGGKTQALFLREARMARGHAEALLPMVSAVMDEAKLDFASLDLVAATLGPGSFTGVRIAIAAARAIALVTKAKLWGTDSLAVMARTAIAGGVTARAGRPFAVAVDARGGKLYFGLYTRDGATLSGPSLLSPQEAAVLLPDDVAAVFGSGAALLSAAALVRGLEVEAKAPDLEPSAAALAALALEADETLPTLHPLYLRPPDAKPQTTAAVPRRT